MLTAPWASTQGADVFARLAPPAEGHTRHSSWPAKAWDSPPRRYHSAMLRHAVALLLAIASTGFAADPSPELAAAPAPTADEVLAAARAADFFYRNHIARLSDEMASPDQKVRSQALAALGRLGDPETVYLLIPMLEGGKGTRPAGDLIGACQAAAAIGQAAPTAPLIRGLLTHPNGEVRLAAYNALPEGRALPRRQRVVKEMISGELERRLDLFESAKRRISGIRDEAEFTTPVLQRVIRLQLRLIGAKDSGIHRMPN